MRRSRWRGSAGGVGIRLVSSWRVGGRLCVVAVALECFCSSLTDSSLALGVKLEPTVDVVGSALPLGTPLSTKHLLYLSLP